MADKDKNVDFAMGLDIEGFVAGFNKAKSEAKNSTEQITASVNTMGAALNKVTGLMGVLAGVVAGGAIFKGAIKGANDWTSENVKLAKSLGITTEEASVLNLALGDVYVESGVMVQASQAMSKQLHGNAQAFEVLGVKTKDANGHFRPTTELMAEVNDKLRAIKNPIEQNIAGMQVYGKGWGEIKSILKLTQEGMDEARAKAERLHLIVGPDGVAQTKAYKAAMNDIEDVGKSLQVQLGSALLPTFVKLGAFLGSEGPVLAEIFGKALSVVGETCIKLYYTVLGLGTVIGGLAAAVTVMFTDGFGAASKVVDQMIADVDELGVKANKALAEYSAVPASRRSDDGDSSTPYNFGKEGAEKAASPEKSRVSAWDASLAEAQVYYQRTNDLRQISKEAEAEYWRSILRMTDLTEGERIAVSKKAAEAELAVLKEQAATRKAIGAEIVNASERDGLAEIAWDKQEAQALYQQGQISKLELLQLEREYQAQEFAIRLAAEQQRLDELANDEVAWAAHYQKILALRQQFDLQQRSMDIKLQQEGSISWQGFFGSIGNGFANIVQTFAQGTMTIGKFFQSMGNIAISAVSDMLKTVVGNWIKSSAIYRSLIAGDAASQQAASASTVATKSAEATGVVGANAAEAASGAAASQASIPYVGPALAIAAFAATMAMVLGARSSIKSARGGYDIPSGVNPVTQLHEDEMVLPAEHARTIRELGRGGGSNAAPVELKGVSAGEFFIAARKDLIAVLKGARREFAY